MVLQYRVFIPNTKRKIYFTLITFQFYFNKSIVSHFVKYSSSKEANLHLIRSLFISMHQYYGKRLLVHNSVFTIKQRSEVICQRNETISVSHEVLEKWYTPYYIYSQWQKTDTMVFGWLLLSDLNKFHQNSFRRVCAQSPLQ